MACCFANWIEFDEVESKFLAHHLLGREEEWLECW